MLRWLFRKKLDDFDREYGYDSSYVREIVDTDLDAAWRFSKVMGLTTYRKGVPAAPLCAAGLASTLAEDCGPCTQLGVTMAEREGVPPAVIRAILDGDTHAMPEDVSLAYRFAQAVLRHDADADSLREQVVSHWGKKGLISLGYAITMGRFFPTLKYALGHARACTRVKVGNEDVKVHEHLKVV